MCRPQRSGNKAEEIEETEDDEILPRHPSTEYKESSNTEPAGKRALADKRAKKVINSAINDRGHARWKRNRKSISEDVDSHMIKAQQCLEAATMAAPQWHAVT